MMRHDYPNPRHYVPDLLSDPAVVKVNGKAAPLQLDKGYATFTRTWKPWPGVCLNTPHWEHVTFRSRSCGPGGAIGDFVWNDLNSNGLQDANEPGAPGVTVTLTGGPGGATVTDAQGYYKFTGLPAGNYTVTITLPAGKVLTIKDAPANSNANDTIDSDGLVNSRRT